MDIGLHVSFRIVVFSGYFPSSGISLVAQTVKNLPALLETCLQPLSQEDVLEKGMATQSSILAWIIPWTEAIVHRVSKSWIQLSDLYLPFFHGSFSSSESSNLHTILLSSCINLHSHQQCGSIPFSPHPLQRLLFLVLFWCEVIPHCSFDLSNFDHLFMSLLAICVSSLEKCLFRSSNHFFWLDCLFFWYWAVCTAYIF